MNARNALIFCLLLLASSLFAQVRTLDFYLQSGAGNSPVLKDYSAQLTKNALDSSLLNAERKPQVDGITSLSAAPTYRGWGYDPAITNGYNLGIQAGVTQSLFAKKRYAPQYTALQIESQSISNSSSISAHELTRDITNQYLAAYSTLNQLNYTQSLLKLLQDEEPLLDSFVHRGIYRQTDLLAFQLEKQLQELAVSQLAVQYRTDLGQLNIICGITDTSYYELAAPALFPSTAFLPSSPFLMQFRVDSLRLVNSRSLVDARYRPRFGWYADAGILSSAPATMYRNVGISFGFFFSVPIYDGNRKGLEYQKIAVNENIRFNYSQFFLTQRQLHVSQLEWQLTQTEKLIAGYKKIIGTSDALMNANKLLLDKGQASVTDFILSVKNNVDIKNQLNSAEITRLQLINQINYWNW